MDGLDGFFARKRGCSDLGRELDSLADMVSFGVLPSLILLKLGYLYSAIPFLLASMYRLARFNVLKSEDFVGLPTTVSALIVSCTVALNFPQIDIFALILSLLMVSGLRYFRVKNRTLTVIFGLTLILAVFSKVFYIVVLLMLTAYVISPAFNVRL